MRIVLHNWNSASHFNMRNAGAKDSNGQHAKLTIDTVAATTPPGSRIHGDTAAGCVFDQG